MQHSTADQQTPLCAEQAPPHAQPAGDAQSRHHGQDGGDAQSRHHGQEGGVCAEDMPVMHGGRGVCAEDMPACTGWCCLRRGAAWPACTEWCCLRRGALRHARRVHLCAEVSRACTGGCTSAQRCLGHAWRDAPLRRVVPGMHREGHLCAEWCRYIHRGDTYPACQSV